LMVLGIIGVHHRVDIMSIITATIIRIDIVMIIEAARLDLDKEAMSREI